MTIIGSLLTELNDLESKLKKLINESKKNLIKIKDKDIILLLKILNSTDKYKINEAIKLTKKFLSTSKARKLAFLIDANIRLKLLSVQKQTFKSTSEKIEDYNQLKNLAELSSHLLDAKVDKKQLLQTYFHLRLPVPFGVPG